MDRGPATIGVALVDLLYQFWVHTELVGKLGWFDRWFCSPSNHRVHHAVNDAYLDKNYGGIWMVWDRMFGTFLDEDLNEPCVYGTRSALNSWDPMWANLEGYAGVVQGVRHAQSWPDKLRVFYKPPGWQPADVAARFPKPAFDIAYASRKFDLPISPVAKALAIAVLLAMLQCVGMFLWFADRMPIDAWAWGVALLGATLWVQGALLQQRVSPPWAVALFVLLGVLAAFSPLPSWISFTQYQQELFSLR